MAAQANQCSRSRRSSETHTDRFDGQIVFNMRAGNDADFHIGCELILDDYKVPLQPAFESIIDGGANIGMFCIQAAKAQKNARIVAYEPNPDNIAQLKRNLKDNSANVDVRQAALWSCDTTLHFSADTSMSGTVGVSVDGVEVAAEKPIVTNNTWLKLDIEGAEYEVLPEILRERVLPSRIDMEVHDHDKRGKALCQQLTNAGYVLHGDVESNKPCIFLTAFRKA